MSRIETEENDLTMASPDLNQRIFTLTQIVHELVETVRDQSKELQRLAVLLEQQTDLRDEPREFGVEASRLSELLRRARSFRAEIEGELVKP